MFTALWVCAHCGSLYHYIGSAAAKYAGQYVHKQLVDSEAYKAKRWSESLKRAFLDTDEDMRKGAPLLDSFVIKIFLTAFQTHYTNETPQDVPLWRRS